MKWSCSMAMAGAVLLFAGCATSMTPSQFNEQLPKATGTKFYDRMSATKAVSEGQCKLLVTGRKYTAPMGLTVSEDLKNSALGIDEWVQADGGNAYAVSSFEWVAIGEFDATQLTIVFDTMHCG